jgi:hypothetical protein
MSLELAETFHPAAIASQIPREIALAMGRQLVNEGYTLVAGYVTSRDNPMTIGTILAEMDAITHRPVGNKNTVLGPYYAVVDETEHYPVGLGVWRPPHVLLEQTIT